MAKDEYAVCQYQLQAIYNGNLYRVYVVAYTHWPLTILHVSSLAMVYMAVVVVSVMVLSYRSMR